MPRKARDERHALMCPVARLPSRGIKFQESKKMIHAKNTLPKKAATACVGLRSHTAFKSGSGWIFGRPRQIEIAQMSRPVPTMQGHTRRVGQQLGKVTKSEQKAWP